MYKHVFYAMLKKRTHLQHIWLLPVRIHSEKTKRVKIPPLKRDLIIGSN
jgi:hypothetical protein